MTIQMNRTMIRRIAARKIEGDLKALLETFDLDDPQGQFEIMDKGITDFLSWLWDESPIA